MGRALENKDLHLTRKRAGRRMGWRNLQLRPRANARGCFEAQRDRTVLARREDSTAAES